MGMERVEDPAAYLDGIDPRDLTLSATRTSGSRDLMAALDANPELTGGLLTRSVSTRP